MSISDAGPSRRTVVRGAAWSVPVLATAAVAPAFAASGAAQLTPVPLSAVKWGKDANDLWHVSWDLTLVNGAKTIDALSVTFTYVPTSGRSFDSFVVKGYDPLDTTWSHVVNPAVPPGPYTVTATHEQDIPANATYNLHADFAGVQNNSAGTVSAVATMVYSDGTSTTVTTPAVSWAAGSPHAGH